MTALHPPDRQREVLVLRFYLDLADTDIARDMGISKSTVRPPLTGRWPRSAARWEAANEPARHPGGGADRDRRRDPLTTCRRCGCPPARGRPALGRRPPGPGLAGRAGTAAAAVTGVTVLSAAHCAGAGLASRRRVRWTAGPRRRGTPRWSRRSRTAHRHRFQPAIRDNATGRTPVTVDSRAYQRSPATGGSPTAARSRRLYRWVQRRHQTASTKPKPLPAHPDDQGKVSC